MKTFGNILDGVIYTKREGVYGICINSADRVALIEVNGDYFLPGGGIELGESQFECLYREFIEETGYSIEIGEYVSTMRQYHFSTINKEYYELIGNFYVVNIADKVAEKIEIDHDLVWESIDEVKSLLFLDYQVDAIQLAYKVKYSKN